jgi:NAD(P)-dependent dehydrogenase (short-subunit alcohol dehydrogenase family)
MAKIFITGSADGLGQLAAQALVTEGHEVILHARNAVRAQDALSKTPGAKSALTADLADLEEVKKLAEEVNKLGPMDSVIHNAGVYQASSTQLLYVNTLAPYILTCLIEKPKRLIYLSSGMHLSGTAKIDRLDKVTYSDTKLHMVLLAKAVARLWPDVQANAVDPGWVPTKMGGAGAPDDLQKGYETQVWLATHDGASGKYYYHQKETRYNPAADDIGLQNGLLSVCEALTGVKFK